MVAALKKKTIAKYGEREKERTVCIILSILGIFFRKSSNHNLSCLDFERIWTHWNRSLDENMFLFHFFFRRSAVAAEYKEMKIFRQAIVYPYYVVCVWCRCIEYEKQQISITSIVHHYLLYSDVQSIELNSVIVYYWTATGTKSSEKGINRQDFGAKRESQTHTHTQSSSLWWVPIETLFHFRWRTIGLAVMRSNSRMAWFKWHLRLFIMNEKREPTSTLPV